jgi:hypothetical protein
MDQVDTLTKLLRSSVEVGYRFIKRIRITPRSKDQKRMSMLIYNNLIQKGDSVLTLVDAEKAVGIEVIARSAFENYIDLINLFKHRSDYLQYVMYMSSDQQERSIQNLIKNRQSPFSESIIRSMPEQLGITIEQSLEMVKEEKSEFRSGLSRVYTDGNKPISEPRARVNTSVRLRGELAGKLDEYESLYRVLSRSTHSDFVSMLRGVFKGDGYVWPPEAPQPSLFVIDSVTMMIQETTEILAKKLRKPFPAVRKLIKERQQLHSNR